MNEELIRDIVDLQANKQVKQLTSDLELNNKALQDNIVAAKQLNDILSQSKGFIDYNKNAAAATKQAEQLAKLTAQRQLQEERLAAFRANEQAKADARAAKEEANLKKIEDANNKAAEAARKRASVTHQSEPYTGSSNGSTISSGATVNPANIEAANAANQASTVAYNQNTEAVKNNALSKRQLALAEAQAKENLRQNVLALKNQAKELNAAKGSLDQRRAALIRLRTTFDSLNEAERATPFGQRLAKTIPQLNEQVLTLEKSTGRAQRNVGNYTNAFASGAQKAFSALRLVANILPGVGLAGLLGFAVGPIIDYIAQLDIFKAKARDIILQNAAASSEFSKAISDINALKTSISEFQSGLISKTELVNRFNEGIGKSVGELKTAAEVEAFYNSKAGAFVEGMFLRAQASAALQKATEDATKAVERATGGTTFGDKLAGFFANVPEIFEGAIEDFRSTISNPFDGRTNIKGLQNSFKLVTEFAKKAQTQAVNELKQTSKTGFQLFDELQKQADAFAKKNGLNFGAKPEQNKDREAEARRSAAALIQIEIDALKEAQGYYQKNLDNQNFGLDARLDSLQQFSEVAQEIAKKEADKEKAAKKLTANEILAIDADTLKKQQDIRNNSADKVVGITRQAAKRTSDALAEQREKDLKAVELARDEELIVLTESYNNGFITLETFTFRKEEIERNYTSQYIGLQIEQTKAYIKQLKIRGENTDSAEAQLAAIQLKYSQIRVNNGKTEHNKLIEKAKERFELEKQIGQELFNLTSTLIKRGSELRLNALQDEAAALDKRRNFDIEQVNDSVATEEQKADKIAIINAKADAQQRVIDERVRQEKIRQAKADKAAAIAQAIINGALAMTKVAAQTGVLSFAFSPLITALTAVQVAAIVAQPIPKYKDGKGKGNNYSGAAWVGDGGMSELIIEPNGRMFVTPNKPTLTNVSSGTQVISGPDFKRMVGKPNTAIANNSTNQMIDISALVTEQRAATKAFKSQKSVINMTTEKGHQRINTTMDKVSKRIRSQFGKR